MTDIITIKDVFDKRRDPLRHLNTIVKVYDDSPESIWVEFEEFILTEALQNSCSNDRGLRQKEDITGAPLRAVLPRVVDRVPRAAPARSRPIPWL